MGLLKGLNSHRLDSLGGSNIKSIQSFQVSLTSHLTYTVNIEPVNLEKAVILYLGSRGQGLTAGRDLPCIYFANNSQVIIERYDNFNNYNLTVSFQVIEFENGKVQRGITALNSGDNNITIEEVKMEKTIVLPLTYASNSTTQTMSMYSVRVRLSTTTNLFINSYLSMNKAHWQLIEFA